MREKIRVFMEQYACDVINKMYQNVVFTHKSDEEKMKEQNKIIDQATDQILKVIKDELPKEIKGKNIGLPFAYWEKCQGYNDAIKEMREKCT